MGLIKAAILIGAGSYALNKYNKSREGHQSCSCNHNRRDANASQDANQPIGTWSPGSKMRGVPEVGEKSLPYREEKSLPYQDGGLEKEGWVGGEKELGGMRNTYGA